MSALGVAIRALSTGAGLLIVGVLAMSLLAGPSDKPTARRVAATPRGSTRWLAALVLVSGVAALGWQVTVVTGRADSVADGAAWLRLLGSDPLRHGVAAPPRDPAAAWRPSSSSARATRRPPTGSPGASRRGSSPLAGVGLAAWAGHAVGGGSRQRAARARQRRPPGRHGRLARRPARPRPAPRRGLTGGRRRLAALRRAGRAPLLRLGARRDDGHRRHRSVEYLERGRRRARPRGHRLRPAGPAQGRAASPGAGAGRLEPPRACCRGWAATAPRWAGPR